MRAIKHALLLLTFMAGGVFCSWAQTASSQRVASRPAQEPQLSSNRYLLIVDTSRSMRDRTNAIAKVVQTVLLSGMDGQMRFGDTLGVWTYNEHLYAGQFPLQLWAPNHIKRITMQTLQFVENQKYDNKSKLAEVMSDLLPLIKHSDFITVTLLTDGADEIHGTPFDAKINDFFQAWKDKQERLKMPIVVFLRGQKGQITDYRVSTPPWPLDSLPPPPPLKPTPANKIETTPAPASNPEPRRMLPPLIVHGSQTVSAETTTPVSPAEASTQPTSTVLTGTLKVNAAPATQKENGAAPSSRTQPASGNTTAPVPESVKPEAGKSGPAKNTLTNAAVPPVEGTVSPSDSLFQQKKAWIAGSVLLAVMLGLLWLLVRRSHDESRISLITRSLDQDDNQSRF